MEVMKSFDAGWKKYQPQFERVFNVERGPMRVEEKFSVRGGIGQFTPVADGAPYNIQTPKVVGTQTIDELEYKDAIAITRRAKNKDHYGSIMQDAKQLGYYYRLHMDKLAADLLNGATGTTVTWDGLSLSNSAHLIGDTGDTQSNVTSGGLGTTTLETAIQNLSLQKDHNGRVMSLPTAAMVVPSRNWAQSKKLLGSTLTPEDGNNSINFVTEMGLRLIVWPQLVTTNFEAMLISDMNRLEYLVHYGPELTADRDSSTGNDLVQIEMLVNAGAVDYLGTYFITS